MEETYYYLYQITSKINGKIYVGVHKTKNLNDHYMGSGFRLLKVQKLYGLDSFEKIILEFFNNEEEMYSREAEIVDTTFLNRNDVYNLREGGSGGCQLGENNSQYGTCVIYKIENNEKLKKRVKKEEIEKYIKEGWMKVNHNPPDRFCSNPECNKKLGYRNKSGLCKNCNPRLKRFRDKLK